MKIKSLCLLFSLAGALTLSIVPTKAALITVDEIGRGASRNASISGPIIGNDVDVLAGVIHLEVDGMTMNGFCIDPFHLGLPSSSQYQYISLPDGPKGDAMGAETATLISRLWGTYYRPDMSSLTAAGLQIAIWRLTGDGFILNSWDYGAEAMLLSVSGETYHGPVADLVGLTGPGQDYVVQRVPDGGPTLAMAGVAFLGLFVLARKTRS